MATTGTTDQRDAEAARAAVRAMWASVAPQWATRADEVDARGAAVAARMLAIVALPPGARVLELACGPGGLGLAAAELVGPTGAVIVSDVVPEMVAIAAARAAERGLTQVSGCTLDLEDIDQPDASFDAVLCRDGFMFAFDPVRAGVEARRALRPGGRVALAVWGPRAANPWLGLAFDAVTDVTGFPVPPPGVPGPFALGDADHLREVLVAADIADVTVEAFDVPMTLPSFDAWWARTRAVAGPLAMLLAGMPDATRDAVADRLRAAAVPHTRRDGSLSLPGVNLVASGRRA